MNFLSRMIPVLVCVAVVTPSTIKGFKHALNMGLNTKANNKAMEEVMDALKKNA